MMWRTLRAMREDVTRPMREKMFGSLFIVGWVMSDVSGGLFLVKRVKA